VAPADNLGVTCVTRSRELVAAAAAVEAAADEAAAGMVDEAHAELSEHDAASVPVHPKSDAARELLLAAVRESTLLAGCTPSQLDRLLSAMAPRPMEAEQVVFTQGEPGEHFYVVGGGEFGVLLKHKGDTPVHTYKEGSSFGEVRAQDGGDVK
jgi:hypothetical protein